MQFIYMYNGTNVSECTPRQHTVEWRYRSNQSYSWYYMVVTAELHGPVALSLGNGSPVGGLLS